MASAWWITSAQRWLLFRLCLTCALNSYSPGRFTGQLMASDPLQTVFQLLSGRIPAVATVQHPHHKLFTHLHHHSCLLRGLIVMIFSQCCGNEKWGDWRPHLAAMLSNETGDPAVQQKAIVTMGDTLGTDTAADNRPLDIVSIQIYKLIGLCCCSLCSLQRPLTCRPCVLPDSQRSLWGVHAEGRQTGASWQQPQVSCTCSSILSPVYLPSMSPQC